MSEIRFNPVDAVNVIISEERSERPFSVSGSRDFSAGSDESLNCPFCEGNEDSTPKEVYALRDKRYGPDQKGWKVRVVPNKFPVLGSDQDAAGVNAVTGFFKRRSGYGIHEVLIETPVHGITLGELTEQQIRNVLSTYISRLNTISRMAGIKYVSVFKNHGARAGASLEHEHSQIIATDFIPSFINRRLKNLTHYYNNEKSCMICDIVDNEILKDQRIVYNSKRFVILTPYWAGVPFEVWIIPKVHNHLFSRVSEDELADLAATLKLHLMVLKSFMGDIPYNMVLNLLPLFQGENAEDNVLNNAFHWYFTIMPRLNTMAGFELGTGVNINTASPEYVKAILKNEIKSII